MVLLFETVVSEVVGDEGHVVVGKHDALVMYSERRAGSEGKRRRACRRQRSALA